MSGTKPATKAAKPAAAKPAAAAKSEAAPKAAAPAKAAAKPEAKAAPAKAAEPVKAAPVKTKEAPASATKTKVPESFLKKRKTGDAIKAKRDAAKTVHEKKKRAARKDIFKRAEKYVKEYRTAQRSLVRSKRQAKNNGNYFIEDMPKVLLVVRVRGIMCVAPKTKKILQLFRLLQLNNATFIKVNFATMTMLSYIEPYVTYGKPSLKTISELIYKRGFAKVNKQRIPLTDNKIIADNLGKHNIICVEDLIHEIHTCGPNFKEANNFLWPFKLSNPLGGWKNKGIHFAEGGDAGNREEMINKLVQRMN
jgi:large subunit ribosomal protein L7e